MKNQIISFWTLLLISTAALSAQSEIAQPTVDWSKLQTAKSSGDNGDKKDPIWLVQAWGN